MNCFYCGKPITNNPRGGFSFFCSKECEKAFAKDYNEVVETLDTALPENYLDEIVKEEQNEKISS